MTEAEWLTRDSLNLLLSIPDDRKSKRKLRLALCACVRSQAVWSLLTSKSSRRAVEVSEAFADGTKDKRELRLAQKSSGSVPQTAQTRIATGLASVASYQDSWLVTYGVRHFFRVSESRGVVMPSFVARDVFPNPFRPVPGVNPAWHTPSVSAIAPAAYEERELPSGHLDPVRLSILADALEDAGCTDVAVLSHLRSPGPHVRGCWALDLILGKS